MADISFIIQIISSVLALSGSYALVMTALKKEHNERWLKAEALITLAAAGFATAFSFTVTIVAPSLIFYVSLGALYSALALTLGLLIAKKVLPSAKVHSVVKNLSILIFSALLLHLLFELVAIAWF